NFITTMSAAPSGIGTSIESGQGLPSRADNRGVVEPKTSNMPVAGTDSGRAPQGGRLLVASRLATALSRAGSVERVADEAVRTLHDSFDYYLAVVQRLDGDGVLRVVAAAGPLAEETDDF